MRARAGNITITGATSAAGVSAGGRACAESAEVLAQVGLRSERVGGVLRLVVDLPEPKRPEPSVEGFSTDAPVPGAGLHLEISIPEGLPLRVAQSWGELAVTGVAELAIEDAIGDIKVKDVAGGAAIHSLFGDVQVSGVGGDLEIAKLRGEARIERIGGSLDVVRNPAGELTIDEVGGDVRIREDGLGDLKVSNVRGSLTVENDVGGDVVRSNIDGAVTLAPRRGGPPHARRPG